MRKNFPGGAYSEIVTGQTFTSKNGKVFNGNNIFEVAYIQSGLFAEKVFLKWVL